MSQYVFLMFYSTLVAYACFKKRTLFRDILYRFTEMNISMMFYNVQQKIASMRFYSLGCGSGMSEIAIREKMNRSE
jgi:hypothetical protein